MTTTEADYRYGKSTGPGPWHIVNDGAALCGVRAHELTLPVAATAAPVDLCSRCAAQIPRAHTDPKMEAQAMHFIRDGCATINELNTTILDTLCFLHRGRSPRFSEAAHLARDAGITPTQVAKALGVTRQAVHHMMRQPRPSTPGGETPEQ